MAGNKKGISLTRAIIIALVLYAALTFAYEKGKDDGYNSTIHDHIYSDDIEDE